MPKGVKRLEHEIADWKHYKLMGTWMDGKKPYKTFTDADDQIEKLEKLLKKAKEKEAKKGGTRRRRHRTRSTRRR